MMANMKKSISGNVWVNYLHSLKTQGETFHVINISWFSMKVYHKFCSFNICSSFSAGSIYKGTKRTLQYIPHNNLQQPKSFIVHVWHFQWRKFEAQYLDNIYVSTSSYWHFCAKNIMTYILKTPIWDYSWGKAKL